MIMHLNNELYTLKIRDNESVIIHIHTFRSHLESLLTVGLLIAHAIFLIMQNLLLSDDTFICYLKDINESFYNH